MTIVLTDEGEGVTQHSLDHLKEWLRIYHDLQLVELHIDSKGRTFNTEIFGILPGNSYGRTDPDSCVILLSGLNCGYGGEGPHGLKTALEWLNKNKPYYDPFGEQLDLNDIIYHNTIVVDFRDAKQVIKAT